VYNQEGTNVPVYWFFYTYVFVFVGSMFVANIKTISIMKKITGITLLMLAPLFLGAQSFNFNTDGDTENWKSFGSSTMSVTNGVLKYTPVTPTKDANIQYHKGIDASSSRYVHIVLKTHSKVAETLTFYFKNPDAVFTSVALNSIPSKGYIVYDLDLKEKAGWSGIVNDVRIRLRSKTNTNPTDYYEFEQIVFDNNANLKI